MAKNLSLFLKLDLPLIHHCLKAKTLTPVFNKVRLYASVTVHKKPESELPIYKKKDHEYRISRKATVQTLEKLLNIKTFDAHEIVLKHPSFRQVCKATLKNNHGLYVQKGVSHETLLKYPEILTVVDSEWKLKEIQKLPHEINAVVVLLLLPTHILVRFIRSEMVMLKEEGKIAVLSSHLKISSQRACEYIAQKPFLCSLPADRIEKNIKILIDYGVIAEDICNDLWVLRYSEELIRSRLSIAKEHKIDTMKTWMVRAKQDVFQNYIQRRSDNKSILGNSSLAEYLSVRLECSVPIANYLIVKQPPLKNKSLKKLKELIDFLYAEGFKPQHICRVPKILVHSVETTRKRLKQLEDKGIQIDSLSLLTKSQSQFMQYYEALVKSKNKSQAKT